ncbi:MAG TPA: hypothetical protein VHH12_09945, partial [Mycobacterium sp.]|nr:hypothetical protein [Mycobacterium sp.]
MAHFAVAECTLPRHRATRAVSDHSNGGFMHRRLLMALLPLLAACASTVPDPVGAPTAPAATTVDQAVAGISVADVERRVGYLASDELRGRDTP